MIEHRVAQSLHQAQKDARELLEAELSEFNNTHVQPKKNGNTLVLLTGATGFLGRQVLLSLLRDTGFTIVCLVRATDDEHAYTRLIDALKTYTDYAGDLHGRVTAIAGSITQEQFGIQSTKYSELCAAVDMVCHCAAEVNWISSYRRLRSTNVIGTANVIKFSLDQTVKPILYLSSIAVCYGKETNEHLDETYRPIDDVGGMALGYAQTKSVSEHLLRRAADRGLPIIILRPALITGHTISGHSNTDDLLAALICAVTKLTLASNDDWLIDGVPVNFTADVITRLLIAVSIQVDTPDVLHLIHRKPQSWRALILQLNLMGYAIKFTDTESWLQAAFVDGGVSGTSLYALRNFFMDKPANLHGLRGFETFLTSRQRLINSDKSLHWLDQQNLEAPATNANLLRLYLMDYHKSGLIQAPPIAPPVVLQQLKNCATTDEESIDEPFGLIHDSLSATLQLTPEDTLTLASLNVETDDGIMHELHATKNVTGIFACSATINTIDEQRVWNLVLKLRSGNDSTLSLLNTVASLYDTNLSDLFTTLPVLADLHSIPSREAALYQHAPDGMRKLMPNCIDTSRSQVNKSLNANASSLEYVLMECIDSTNSPTLSSGLLQPDASDLNKLIDQMVTLQSIPQKKLQVIAKLAQCQRLVDTSKLHATKSLWHQLITLTVERSCKQPPCRIGKLHTLIDNADCWWGYLLEQPEVLVHNDFNPRNVFMLAAAPSSRYVAVDWELSFIGPPQHDFAEYLCFCASDTIDAEMLKTLVDQHCRQWYQSQTCSAPCLQAQQNWRRGFASSIAKFALCRLPMYCLINHYRALPYINKLIANTLLRVEQTQHW